MGGKTFLRRLFGIADPRRPALPAAPLAAPADPTWETARARKLIRLRPYLRADLPRIERNGKIDFLTSDLRREGRIADTVNVSSNGYNDDMVALVGKYAGGLVLDCGAGSRPVYYDNVVNYEIVDYPSTDVLGIGEVLPFVDNTFDAVISVAVLEHVRDPFRCASEIARVIKPGGELYCSIPFLQPLHGYPHHYFNASSQGIQALFEDRLCVDSIRVLPSTHPVWSLTWILNSWRNGLPEAARLSFEDMRVCDLIGDPQSYLDRPFCAELSPKAQIELASATVLTATKPNRNGDSKRGPDRQKARLDDGRSLRP